MKYTNNISTISLRVNTRILLHYNTAISLVYHNQTHCQKKNILLKLNNIKYYLHLRYSNNIKLKQKEVLYYPFVFPLEYEMNTEKPITLLADT